MSSLNNLTKSIIKDAETEAARIEELAREQAANIMEQKSAELDALRTERLAQIENEALAWANRLIAEESTRARDKRLAAKQGALDRVFAGALESINKMTLTDFTEYVEKTLSAKDLGEGELILPDKYMDLDEKALSQKLGIKITKHSTRRVSSGFIFVAGGLEYNNTFADLIDYYREELEPEVSGMIF